ncbi:DUF4111 domain-containing protein [Streptomyces luteogriseus]|uniref:DUF4111 domain-containing protein n=1 Tax=Streptomyces luteogriseus TaxID=68233 RepID=UPI0037926C8E
MREPTRDGQRRVLVRELPDHLRRAIVAGVPEPPEELATDTRNVLLTLARAWTTLDAGGIRSKDAAAERVAARLPAAHRPVLDHARAVHLGDEDERWDELGVRPCAELQVRVIEESYAS